MVAGGWWWPMQAAVGGYGGWLGRACAPAPAPLASPSFHVACHKTHLLPRGMTVREHQLHLLSTWHATRLIFLPRGHTPHIYSYNMHIAWMPLDCLHLLLDSGFRICATEAIAERSKELSSCHEQCSIIASYVNQIYYHQCL
jgi:hypothetical protein